MVMGSHDSRCSIISVSEAEMAASSSELLSIYLKLFKIEIKLIHNIILDSDVWHSDLTIVYITKHLLPSVTIPRYYNSIGYIPYAVLWSLWLIYFITWSFGLFISFTYFTHPATPCPYGNQQSAVFESVLYCLCFFRFHI